MMDDLLLLKDISLLQFKNYPQQKFNFSERIVGICGRNGLGKTNLLDAIHYLCFTKSYFGKTDAAHVLNGAQGFRISGNFQVPEQSQFQEAICILRETGKKEFLLGGTLYDKFSLHIGKFPCVFIAPDDIRIITGTSDERRHFLDTLICQINPVYLRQLVGYNKVLQQRNSYLKSLSDPGTPDKNLLDVYNRQLEELGNYIFEQRKLLLQIMLPSVQLFYQQIAGLPENIDIVYESALLHKSYLTLFNESLPKDLVLQRTTQGIHRDEIEIRLNGQSFKAIASQGQRKSLLFALKLAEFSILKDSKGFPPLILLDDVFEKLDEQRMQNLMDWVCIQNKGQVFITDTHKDRLQRALQELKQDFQLIELK